MGEVTEGEDSAQNLGRHQSDLTAVGTGGSEYQIGLRDEGSREIPCHET